MLDKFDVKYTLVYAVIVLFWKTLDLFLYSEELETTVFGVNKKVA